MLASGGGWMGPRALTWQFVLGMGMAWAVTARMKAVVARFS